jgi:hypothetical protein
VPINGPTAAGVVPVQYGPTASVDPGFGPAYRVGFDHIVNDCGGSIFAEFTNFRVSTDDSTSTTAPLVLRSMVVNPTTLNAGSDSLNADANEVVEFDLVDVGYRFNLWSSNLNSIGLLVGIRYGHLGQSFHADYDNIITESIDSKVNFDCVGPRFGADGNYCIGRGFYVHGKAAASFLGGEARADYSDNAVAAPASPLDTTTWHEARYTTVVDTEISIGWQSCNGHLKLSVGYSLTDWYTVVKPSDFIAGVQVNGYHGANEVGQTSLLFDGLMAHAELDW